MIALGALAAAVGAVLLLPPVASAGPRVTGAEARIEFVSTTSCHVDLTLHVADAPEVTQRVEVVDGASVDLRDVSGATIAGPPKDLGRTRLLVTRADGGAYTLRYTVQQPASSPGRCPLWVPTIAADGRSASVHLTVRIPDGAVAAGTMPTFAWSGEEGSASIGHLPAFVRVPFALPGEPAPWNIAGVMDLLSIATLVAATLAWAGYQRRRGQSPSPDVSGAGT